MSQGLRILLNCFIAAEVVFLLLPTSIICAVGLLFAAAFIFRSPTNVALWMLAGCVVLMAYSLFSLWWLIFKYRSIRLPGIPRSIWIGLVLGVVAAIALSSPHLLAVASGDSSIRESAKYILGFGIGPAIVLATVLSTIWYRAKTIP
ncbi:MAG: hypothetical protein NVV67_03525 [Pseudoxanthomonas sp.]|nr:hypothetical protein [Pseudoxanthomonas sp.]